MSPLQTPPPRDGSTGVEALFAGEVDASTARADDVTLFDDDAVIVRVANASGIAFERDRTAA